MPLRILAALLTALTLGALGLGIYMVHASGDPLNSWTFRIPIALSAVVYLMAVGWVLRPGNKCSLLLILGVAAILRVALIAGPPLLSSDVYRYVWDGRVQAAGINPYLYLPVDPKLASLRDQAIYPHINRAAYAPTIYPPAAQALFAAVSSISDSVVAMKIAMVGLEAMAIACLLLLLRKAGRPAAQILIYAWNPLALWEFAGNGHVDAAAIGLLALALLLRTTGVRNGWAGFALGAAVLVKFLPAVMIPALWQRGKSGWWFVAGGTICIALLYGFYASFGDAGNKVLGFLGAYGAEEGLDSGSGIWLLAGLGLLVHLPAWGSKLYLSAVVIGLAGLGTWIAFRRRPATATPADVMRVCCDTGLLAACLMVVISPHYAWYFIWLAAPATIAPSRAVIWLSAGSILLYYTPLPDHFLWQSLVFVPAIILAVIDMRSIRSSAPVPALQGNF